MRVKGTGRLSHMFHGTYAAAVVVAFESDAVCSAAVSVLGAGWRIAQRDARCALWHGDSEALSELKAKLPTLGYASVPCGRRTCKHKCKSAEIDGLNHSIDHGPEFTLTFDVVDPRQLALAI